MNPSEELKRRLAECPLVAIIRGVTPDEVEAVGEAIWEAGIRVIEVPLNSPDPFESIRRLAGRMGERALVGAGTKRTVVRWGMALIAVAVVAIALAMAVDGVFDV